MMPSLFLPCNQTDDFFSCNQIDDYFNYYRTFIHQLLKTDEIKQFYILINISEFYIMYFNHVHLTPVLNT